MATVNDDALGENTDPDYEIQYIDIGNVDASGQVRDIATYRFEAAPSRARRLVKDGDVIISTVRTYLEAIAAITKPPGNLIVSTGFAVVRPIPALLDAGYCKYALRGRRFMHEVVARSVGISYPAINASELENIELTVPPLSEQKRIAMQLDTETQQIEELVNAKKKQVELLAEKRRSIITHAVTQGLDPDAPKRDSGIAWLGEIPAHWERPHLRRVLSSMTYGTSESVDSVGAVGILRMGDIKDGSVSLAKLGYLDEIESDLLLRVGDLVFNRTNSLDQIGKVAVIRELPEHPLSFASYLVRLRCSEAVRPEYLNYALNCAYANAFSRSEALPAIGQANLNPDRFSYLRIPLPPVAEQMEIERHLSQSVMKLNGLMASTEKTVALLQERRTALISAAVSGQLVH